MQSTRRDPLDANSGQALCFSGGKQGLVGKRPGRPLSWTQSTAGEPAWSAARGMMLEHQEVRNREHVGTWIRTGAQRRSSSPVAVGCRGLG